MIETLKIGTLRWSHIVLPTEDDLNILQEKYHFHPLDIEDCRTLINLRPKIDIYDDYYFLILHFPSFDPTRTFVEIKEVKVFWGKDFLITLGKSHWLVKEIFSQQMNKTGSEKTLEVVHEESIRKQTEVMNRGVLHPPFDLEKDQHEDHDHGHNSPQDKK